MLKVICIDDSNGILTGERPNFKVGDLVEVSQCEFYNHCYDVAQHLFNCKTGNRKSWKKSRFIPLSNIDETELIKERQEYETTV